MKLMISKLSGHDSCDTVISKPEVGTYTYLTFFNLPCPATATAAATATTATA